MRRTMEDAELQEMARRANDRQVDAIVLRIMTERDILLAVARIAETLNLHRNGDGNLAPYLDALHTALAAAKQHPQLKAEIEKRG